MDLAERSFLLVHVEYYREPNDHLRTGIRAIESVPGTLVLAVLAHHFNAALRGNDVRGRAQLPFRGETAPPGQPVRGEALVDFMETSEIGQSYGYPKDGWVVIRNDDLEGADLFAAEWRRKKLTGVDWG